MTMSPVSISEVISTLPGPWQQRDLATANDAVIRVARFEGAFPWHTHEDDELFICWDGSFRIELQEADGPGTQPQAEIPERGPVVTLNAGQLFVVPAGIRHRPVADQTAHALMVERPGTEQYGR